MVATNSDYTGSEIAAIIGWRYVRNNQDRWHTSQIAEEFDLHRGTVRGIFSKRESQNGYLQPMREYVLSGDPIPANGKPLTTQAGAFVIACHLPPGPLALVRELDAGGPGPMEPQANGAGGIVQDEPAAPGAVQPVGSKCGHPVGRDELTMETYNADSMLQLQAPVHAAAGTGAGGE